MHCLLVLTRINHLPDLKDHVKEMESKLITAADGDSGGGGVSTYNLLHEPGTTDTEKATSDSGRKNCMYTLYSVYTHICNLTNCCTTITTIIAGLEKRMKCIETKVEAATSIMKGLSDRVDKVYIRSSNRTSSVVIVNEQLVTPLFTPFIRPAV